MIMSRLFATFFFVNIMIFRIGFCFGQFQNSSQIEVKQNFGINEKYEFEIQKYSKYYLLNHYN